MGRSVPAARRGRASRRETLRPTADLFPPKSRFIWSRLLASGRMISAVRCRTGIVPNLLGNWLPTVWWSRSRRKRCNAFWPATDSSRGASTCGCRRGCRATPTFASGCRTSWMLHPGQQRLTKRRDRRGAAPVKLVGRRWRHSESCSAKAPGRWVRAFFSYASVDETPMDGKRAEFGSPSAANNGCRCF